MFELHHQKALYSGNADAIAEFPSTPQHPSATESFVLLISTIPVTNFYPSVPTESQYDTSSIRDIFAVTNATTFDDAGKILAKRWNDSMDSLRKSTPGAGTYFNEADYFEPNWQDTFWGAKNYARLLEIKKKWDPNGLFYCHHCVGSELW